MKALKNGSDYKRCSGFVEVEACRSDKYNEVTLKVAECLEIPKKRNQSYALFKMNGTRILDKDLSINKKKKPWLMGNYLTCVKKSAAQLKLGIGIISIPKEV